MKLRGSIMRFALTLFLGALVLLAVPQRAEAISYCCDDCTDWMVACYADCGPDPDPSCIDACNNDSFFPRCLRFCSHAYCKDPCGGCPTGLSCVENECVDLGGGGACSFCPPGTYCSGVMCAINPTCPTGQFACKGVCVTNGVPCP